MWFADVGQVIASYVAAAWVLVASIALSMRRTAIGAVAVRLQAGAQRLTDGLVVLHHQQPCPAKT
jgi:hypothetical protein